MNLTPTDITIDKDNEQHTASFSYYDGIQYAKDNNLKQTTSFTDVSKGTHFIVCCGDVMVKIEPLDFSTITRRII